MLLNTAILLLLCNIPRVSGWAPSPGTCYRCCCCVVANEGTRNFYAVTSGSFTKTTIPNCYYLQSHLSDVLTQWEGQGEGSLDEDTWPGQFVYWEPTDPAYGCYNNLATVTATDFGATSTSVSVESTSSNSGSSTTSPQSKYLSDRSFSITLIIFHKATASQGPNVPHSHPTWQLGVGLGLGISIVIIAIWFLLPKSSSEVTCCSSIRSSHTHRVGNVQVRTVVPT